MNGAFAPKMYELERKSFIPLISVLQMGTRRPLRNTAGSAGLLSLVDRHELAPRRTGVELARAPDLVLGVRDHLVPLRDPADGAGEREDAGEHGDRDAERP